MSRATFYNNLTPKILPPGYTGIRKGDGVTEWYVDGKYHREDGPAVIWKIEKWNGYCTAILYTEILRF